MGFNKKDDTDRTIKGLDHITLTEPDPEPVVEQPTPSATPASNPQPAQPANNQQEDTTTEDDTTGDDSQEQFIDYETWLMMRFGSEYLKLNQQELFDLYVTEILGYSKVDQDGKVTYEKQVKDENGDLKTENLSENQAAFTQAGIAAGTAGITSLFNSYLKDGSLDEKDWAKSASSSGAAYGSAFAGAGGAGLLGGADSAIQSYLDDGEVDWEGVGWDAGSSIVTNSASQGGGAAAGAGAGLLMQGLQDKMTANDTDAQSMLGIAGAGIGGGVAGPAGALVGGMAGSAIGADMDRADEFDLALLADETKPAIYFEDGQVKTNKINYVFHGYSNVDEVDGIVYHAFDDEEKARSVYESQKKLQAETAQAWQDAINNYDSLSIEEQYLVDQFKVNGTLPTTNEITSPIAGGKGEDGYLTQNAKAGEWEWGKDSYNVVDMGEVAKLNPGNIIDLQESKYISNNESDDAQYYEDLRAMDQEKVADFYADQETKGATLNANQKNLVDTYRKLNQVQFDYHGYVTVDGKRYTRSQLFNELNKPVQPGPAGGPTAPQKSIIDQILEKQGPGSTNNISTSPYDDEGIYTGGGPVAPPQGQDDGLLLSPTQPQDQGEGLLPVQQQSEDGLKAHGPAAKPAPATGPAAMPTPITPTGQNQNTTQNPAQTGLTGTAIIPQQQNNNGGIASYMEKPTNILEKWLQEGKYDIYDSTT